MESGWILYVLFIALMGVFWSRARGHGMDDLFRQSHDHHHHVLEVLARHPLGGTWSEHKAWMKASDAEKSARKKPEPRS